MRAARGGGAGGGGGEGVWEHRGLPWSLSNDRVIRWVNTLTADCTQDAASPTRHTLRSELRPAHVLTCPRAYMLTCSRAYVLTCLRAHVLSGWPTLGALHWARIPLDATSTYPANFLFFFFLMLYKIWQVIDP